MVKKSVRIGTLGIMWNIAANRVVKITEMKRKLKLNVAIHKFLAKQQRRIPVDEVL